MRPVVMFTLSITRPTSIPTLTRGPLITVAFPYAISSHSSCSSRTSSQACAIMSAWQRSAHIAARAPSAKDATTLPSVRRAR